MVIRISLLVLVAAFAAICGRLGDRLPQKAAGGDVLSVAFGDARSVLSRAAYHKADSYFHGGVDIDCDHHDHECDEHCDHHEESHHDHSHEHAEVPHSPSPVSHPPSSHFPFPIFHTLFARDPWGWINHHVRAPEVDRHLVGDKAVELMPWFWASVRSDPHNIDAWNAAWYTAAHIMGNRALAGQVIAEAVAKNPQSGELALTEGQHFYDKGRGDLVSARRSFERAQQLVGKDSQVYEFAQRYLDHIKDAHK